MLYFDKRYHSPVCIINLYVAIKYVYMSKTVKIEDIYITTVN